jgi:pectinesterase
MKTFSIVGSVGVALLVVTGSAQAADAVSVKVQNPLRQGRWSETIAVKVADVTRLAAGLAAPKLVVVDDAGKAIDSQLVDSDGDELADELVFQTDLGENQARVFTVQAGERKPPPREQYRVYGRFIRERHDDFAWENDRIARRMYGKALETWAKEPLVSSGIDAWSKRTTRRVINDWYMIDDYHRDNGDGGDFYSVGASRGCGGLGIWSGGKLAVSRNFVSSRVLANGPIRLVFELGYEPWDIGGGVMVAETKRITLDAGQHFDRFESSFRIASGQAPALAVGIGIAKHAGGVAEIDRAAGYLASFEPLKDANGQLGCAVVVGPGKISDYRETATDSLLITPVVKGGPTVYYSGHAWDKGSDVADKRVWKKRVASFARLAFAPARITLSAASKP